jgi:hypothetical protein
MPRSGRFTEKIDDFLHRCSWSEYARDAHRLKFRNVTLRNYAANQDTDMTQAGFLQELHDARYKRQVRSTEKAQSEPVCILIVDGSHYSFRRLPKTSVDNCHACVAQGTGHDLDATVVPVEADLSEDDAEGIGL